VPQIFEIIDDYDVPLAAPTKYKAWALINLILAILTALGSVLLLLGYLGKKKREADPDNDLKAARINRKGGWRLGSLVPGIGAIIVFLLTEDMRLPMVMVDNWTLLMVAIAVLQIVVALFSGKKVTEIENEEAPDAAIA